MNLTQLLTRWPAKDGRLFLLAGGKDADRMPVYYTICDHWRKRVDRMDFERLHGASLAEVAEACRRDPVVSSHRVVCATEIQWPADDVEKPSEKAKADAQRAPLTRLITSLPRDLVLIMSTPAESPKTDNALAQAIIKKGFWVVLKSTDEPTAVDLLVSISGWDEEICREVVSIHGTSPAALLSLARTVKLTFDDPSEEDILSLVKRTGKGHVFELTEAIVQKDLAKALELSASDDVPVGQLIGALDRKLTSLLQFMAEMKKGRSPKEAAMVLKMPGFLVHGLFEATKRWTPQEVLGTWPLLAELAADADRPGGTDVLIATILGA